MAFNLSGSVITQTGTDTDLSGLAAITGVTVLDIGSGADGRTIYAIGNRRLVIQGTLTIDPELEAVFAGTGSPRPVFDVTGTLNLNGEIIDNGVTRHSERLCVWSPYQNGHFGNDPGLRIRNGANLNWNGGAIRIGSAVVFDSGANVVTTGATLFQDKNNDNQLRQSTTAWTCNSFRFNGNDITFIAIPALLNGYQPIGSRGALGFSSSTPNIDFPISGFRTNGSSDSDVRFWAGCRPILTNSENGSALKAVPHVSGNGTAYGVCIVKQEVQALINDSSGNPVEGAKIFTLDTDNGNREIYNREGHVVDATADQTYLQLTGADGKTPVYAITTAYNIVNTGNGDAINTGNYAWDYRGNQNNDSDIFSFNVFSYPYGFAVFDAVLKGTTALEIGTTVFDDPNITETTKATVDAYTEIDTPEKFYDRAKAYLLDNYAGETTTLVARNGSEIDAGNFNITIDPNAAEAFALVGNDITLKATNFVGGLRTTGLVTGKENVNGAIIDSSQDSTLVEVNGGTFSVYANAADRDSNANALATNSTSYGFNIGSTTLLFVRANFEGTILPFDVPVAEGNNFFNTGIAGQLSGINAALSAVQLFAKKASEEAEQANLKLG